MIDTQKLINKYQGQSIANEYYNMYFNWPKPIKITDMDEYNALLQFVYAHCRESYLTKGGHLEKNTIGNRYVYLGKQYSYIKHLVVYNGRVYHFQFWPGYDKAKPEGAKCLKLLRELGKDWIGPYLTGKRADVIAEKAKTDKPLIRIVDADPGVTYTTDDDGIVLHIDLNSAYPAGIAAMIPESRPTWESLYERKLNKDSEAKDIMNLAIGAGQSEHIIGYKFPIGRRYAVNWTNQQLLWQAAFIKHRCGGQVLLFNTDGMWVKMPIETIAYMKKNSKLSFGNKLGEWKIDYTAQKFRIKSRGCYEFVGIKLSEEPKVLKYHPICRGIKKEISDTFVWGDIFHHSPKGYKFDKFISLCDIDEMEDYEEEKVTI